MAGIPIMSTGIKSKSDFLKYVGSKVSISSFVGEDEITYVGIIRDMSLDGNHLILDNAKNEKFFGTKNGVKLAIKNIDMIEVLDRKVTLDKMTDSSRNVKNTNIPEERTKTSINTDIRSDSSKNMLLLFVGLSILSLIILFPTKVVSYQVDVPYIDTEKYDVQVPYEDIESFTAQVPYETTENYVESVPVREQKLLTFLHEITECTSSGLFSDGTSVMKVTNTDSEGGTFTVEVGYTDNSNNFVGDTQSKYIAASTSDTFTYSPTPSSFKSCNGGVMNVPSKTVTTYKDVIKQRTVTKYRDETQYRKVTKTRTETREKEVRKTKTETKEKEVNWLFEFDAIIKFRTL